MIPDSLPGQAARRAHQDLWRVLVISLPLFLNPFSRFNFEPDKAALFRALAWLLLLTYLLGLLRPAGRRHLHWPNPVTALLLALLGLVTLATVFSLEPGRSLWGEARWGQGWLTLAGYYAVFGLATATLREPADREALINALLFASLPVSAYGLVQRMGLDALTITPPWGRIQSTLPHANALAGYLVMVIPFTVHRWLGAEARWRWLWAGLGALQGLALVFTVSRSGWLAALAGVCGYLVVWAGRAGRHRLARVLLAAIAVGLVLLAVFSALPAPGPDAPALWQAAASLFRTSSPTVQVRLLVWQAALAAIRVRPLLGYGPETLDLALPPTVPPGLALYGGLEAVAGRAHNELLELALYAGIPAALVYAALLAAVARRGWRRVRSRDPLSVPLLAAAGASFLNHNLDVATVTTSALFWLMLGMLAAPGSHAEGTDVLEIEWPVARLALALLAAAGIGAVSIWPVAADVVGREGMALGSLGSWRAAEETLARAEALDPRPYAFVDLWTDLALAQWSAGDAPPAGLAVAASRLEVALRRTPTDLRLHHRLVRVRLAQARDQGGDRWAEAYAACQSALVVAPRNPDTHLLCGDLRLWARQPAGALPYYRAAAALAPDYDQPYYNLATVYRWLGDAGRAAEYSTLAEEKRAAWETRLRQR